MSAFASRFSAISLLLLGLAGCGGEEQTAPPPASRPVKTFVVEGAVSVASRSFPGRVDASQQAELAFRVPGRLQEILVREGDLAEQGQVLARLDPSDYQIVLEDREASFENARRNYERARELVDDGNISRIDFDRMETNYRTTSAALSQARKDLEYTVLTSPFRGRIARRLVENFEEVQAKQAIFSLQSIDQLDVIINLPEALLRRVRGNVAARRSVGDDGADRPRVVATAQFEGRGERFPLRPKELATKADENTQTFRATFTMDAPTEFTVLPGMTATVTLAPGKMADAERVRWVPVRAVQADSGLDPRVWVLDPDTMTVSSRPVTIGRMSGNSIEIISGLDGGEEIVAVGAPYLAEGMRLSRMQTTEQAVPRGDDPS